MSKDEYSKSRFKEILDISRKHGIRASISDPLNLRLFLEDLGPSFVKLGQLMSTRPDILPEEYIRELERLQDSVSPEDFSSFKKEIEAELGPIKSNFSYFNEEALASASLSQVYRARLKTGEEVVVKVQRPFARERMASDLRILKGLAPFINFAPTGELIDFREVADELSDAMEKELNFIEEGNNIEKFLNLNRSVNYVASPRVYKSLTTKKVIVMDYVDGLKLDDLEGLLKAGYDLDDLAKKLIYNYFKQVFEDGFFHADPHPGNILVANGRLVYIDFGLMGNLDPSRKSQLNNILESLVKEDMRALVNGVLELGIKTGPVDRQRLERDLNLIYRRYGHQSIKDYDVERIMTQIIQVARTNNLKIPRDVVLLSKGIVTLQGIVSGLKQNLSIMDIALPYFKDRALINFLNDWKSEKNLIKYGLSLKNFPLNLMNSFDKLANDDLKLNIDIESVEEPINQLNRMINRLISAIILIGILVSSSIVLRSNIINEVRGLYILSILGYSIAFVYSIIVLISTYRSGKF